MFKWINCEVLPGMFDAEYYVLVKDAEGKHFGGMFVYDGLVRLDKPLQDKKHPVPGKLRVRAFSHEGDMVSVALPESTMDHGRYMRIPVAQLND